MKKLIMLLVILTGMIIGTGCQIEYEGPKCSWKILRENENNGQEWMSRNTGVFITPINSNVSKQESMFLPMVGN